MIKSLCLINAPSENGFLYPDDISMLHLSLGFGVLSGYLRNNGIEVGLYDLNRDLSNKFPSDEGRNNFKNFFDVDTILDYIRKGHNHEVDSILIKLLEAIDIEKFDAFGISLGADYSFMQIHIGLMLGVFIQRFYNKTVIIGGNNVSLLYIFRDIFDELLQVALKELPYIIKGAGEKVILEIIQKMNKGDSCDQIKKTNGLINLGYSDVSANPEYSPMVVRPDWDGFDLECYYRYLMDENGSNDKSKAISDNLIHFFKWPGGFEGSPGQMVNKYNKIVSSKKIRPRIIIPYIFNYNCPFNCAFCTQSDFERGKVIGGEPDKVLQDIIYLIDKYKSNYFNFVNNSFNFSAKFVDEFCSKVISEGVKFYWSDCGRFNNLTYERLKLMREAGCVKLTFGLDTASEKMIKLIDKKINIEESEKVLRWCQELGIWADIEVILGMPQETDEDFLQTFNYIERNHKYINYSWVNEYFVVPNSLIGRYPEKYGIKLVKDNKSYRRLMDENMKFFMKKEPTITFNAKLYGFDEIGGRTYDEILKDNKKRISQLNKIQKQEFYEASKLFKMLSKINSK